MANPNPVNPFHATTRGNPARSLNNPIPETNGGRGLQITQDEEGWDEVVRDFEEVNPEFSHYKDGHPEELADLWAWIQKLRNWMLNNVAAGPFRAMIKDKIAKTDTIRNAVCVGLGHPFRRGQSKRTCWAHQLAAFLAICRIIEDEKKIVLPTPVYADPCFNLAAKYVIETLVGHRVVKDAFDGNHVDKQSFVYGIHLSAPAVAEGILAPGKHPELYIGPLLKSRGPYAGGVPIAIVDWFVKHAYMKRDVTLPARYQEMIDQALLFQSTHEALRAVFNYGTTAGDEDKKFFNDTYAWVRRKEPLDLKPMMDPGDEDADKDGQPKDSKPAEGSKDSQAEGGPGPGEGEQSQANETAEKKDKTYPKGPHVTLAHHFKEP